ncbi:5'-methylthioadenosine/S-adenosylhomocysteine nucleosidase isoform X2 [Elaeis guineensis]|uniref:5'-methylthioadenosine/S-adenosylhomocysteine nucleosidase 2 isoform X2 n=1 Tax=Elaeis guineensis var. tenera TaxID=51953 RepID=A0A6J0PC36_ELAGV|nr:5'-methylthioadenosine/S-adenosylhomocysteine nucleosidase 2 isoform X2 [Elaeis guineensis]
MTAAGGDGRRISTVLIIIGVPWIRYHGLYKELHINLVWPGKDSVLGVDSVGMISASLVTYASIQALNPDLIINVGTAGGSRAKGACVGDVYLASNVAFHDRRIPIPVFDMYGIGSRRTFSTPNLLKELNLKVGKLSTGDSLDMSPQDEASILANDATIKDMEACLDVRRTYACNEIFCTVFPYENYGDGKQWFKEMGRPASQLTSDPCFRDKGAAVAYVADLLSVPAIFVKAVTDIVDGAKPTSEFLQNLVTVTAALDQAVSQKNLVAKLISRLTEGHILLLMGSTGIFLLGNTGW